ncbi:Alpha-1-syntrophin [Eufriesea mexicana]|nr:Alpha-1-syntrophin [Eufriesea mexicana]
MYRVKTANKDYYWSLAPRILTKLSPRLPGSTAEPVESTSILSLPNRTPKPKPSFSSRDLISGSRLSIRLFHREGTELAFGKVARTLNGGRCCFESTFNPAGGKTREKNGETTEERGKKGGGGGTGTECGAPKSYFRLVSTPTRKNEAGSSSSAPTQHGATFAVRVGTIDGVVTHHLRVETRRDLAAWARAIVQGCHAAALSLREYTVRCTWQGKACQLIINHEDGFALYAAGSRGVPGNGVSPSSPPTPLWRRSFDKLKMSADDGARLLWLDFGGDDGEIKSGVNSIPRVLQQKAITKIRLEDVKIENLLFKISLGAGPRELSQTDRVRPAQLSLCEDPPAGPERIGKHAGKVSEYVGQDGQRWTELPSSTESYPAEECANGRFAAVLFALRVCRELSMPRMRVLSV